MINFGGKPLTSNINHTNNYKTIMFSALLSGLVIWISYRASLTSELSVVFKKYPFNDLDSLSKSNYL